MCVFPRRAQASAYRKPRSRGTPYQRFGTAVEWVATSRTVAVIGPELHGAAGQVPVPACLRLGLQDTEGGAGRCGQADQLDHCRESVEGGLSGPQLHWTQLAGHQIYRTRPAVPQLYRIWLAVSASPAVSIWPSTLQDTASCP